MQENYTVLDIRTQQRYTIESYLWRKNCDEKVILLRYLAIPVQEDKYTLWLALDDENNLTACEIFAFLTHKRIEPVLIASDELRYLLNCLNPDEPSSQEIYHTSEITPNDQSQTDLDDPINRLLNTLFKFCLEKNASDIHIEPQQQQWQIRLRIDGVLHHYRFLPSHFAERLISRLKLSAKLDIAESRLPQDGQFHFTTQFADTLDFRVSSLPTHYGEKLVLRLQKNKPVNLAFQDLGLTDNQTQTLMEVLKQPQGLILVTGPTGSGKSITLYSALNYLNDEKKHILTAEDPIEITLDGIIQSQVNRAIGLDFSQLLRTFLRQDPDIIMLGEIRDEESAQIALRAAQTGHLVLSTLHTNDAPSAIERLLQLGIKEYEIANSLLLVIAQRLIRTLCPKCFGAGCDECFQGYKGRTGVYQFFSKTGKQFNQHSAHLDFKTLKESALQKQVIALTDHDEIERVFGNENQ